jgi:FkbM family methyltransferase
MKRSLFDFAVHRRRARRTRVKLERAALSSGMVRSAANWYYNFTNDAGRVAIYRRSAKIFRDVPASFDSGQWYVDVPPFRLRMPLRKEHAWLDWDSALAVLGHDQEVKKFYATLLSSRYRPEVFVDVGANYGVHSALFLSAGVKIVAFEPNPRCLDYFERVKELNGFSETRWEPIALGESNCEGALAFSETDTWLGTISQSATYRTEQEDEKVTLAISIRRLDDLTIDGENCFIKIDAEGFELPIIRGAKSFLSDRCRFFVFESNGPDGRPELFHEITSLGFLIEQLPIDDVDHSNALNEHEFIVSRGTNYVARNKRLVHECNHLNPFPISS